MTSDSPPFPTDDPQITRARIAQLADVTRPTVTTWAHRFPDFPRPGRAGGRAYFLQSDILRWLDSRPVPPHLRRPEEGDEATYGRRARAVVARGGEETPLPPAPPVVPAARHGRSARRGGEDGNRPVMRELLGPLAQQVCGPGSMENYTYLLAALYFLRNRSGARWAEIQFGATAGRAGSDVLEQTGRAVDEEVRSLGLLPRFTEALSDLVPRNAEALAHVMDLVARLDGHAFQLITEAYETHARLRSREFFTPPGVVRLMLDLARSSLGREPLAVYDPYVRGGEFLAEALADAQGHSLLDAAAKRLTVFGQTTSTAVARLACINLALRGVKPGGLRVSDREPWAGGLDLGGRADLVLGNPPFNMKDSTGDTCRTGTWAYGPPPLDNANFAYVQHGLDVLRAGGRAAIVMPNKAGNSGSAAEAAIRRALVEAGVVECVISMPAKLFSGTAVPVSVWLLRHPSHPCERVHFLDAGHLGTRKGPRSVLDDEDRLSILATYRAHHTDPFRSLFDPEPPRFVPNVSVRREQLLAATCSLNPLDHIPAAQRRPGKRQSPVEYVVEDARSDVERLRERAAEADARARALIEEPTPLEGTETCPPDVVLADICEIKAGPSFTRMSNKDRSADGTVPVVFPRHLREGRVTDTGDERVHDELAKRLGDYRLKAEDIVCVRAGKTVPPALVETGQAGWLISTNVIRIRKRKEVELDPEYLAIWMRRPEVIAWVNDRAAATATPSISTAVLGRMKVRLPSLPQQRRIVELSSVLEDQALAHRELAEAVTRARNLLVEEAMQQAPNSGAPLPV
ncbi:N-6 DNA methylase (plasmid) [Streptomyces sp. NBC_01426]|uniref:N-6 DNA methylase n=1 Tax=Streptomyces sp. NBC_01426 TaxID=2975866 RepID=UPI002E3433EF|nr:N-6 DNA methylase [Streptomyces sp. NBC_01426]